MRKLLLISLLFATNATATEVAVYKHDNMNTRYIMGDCMIKTLRTDVYTGVRGYFTIVNKQKSKFAISQGGRRYAYIQSTAGKAIIVGSCIQAHTTLDEAVDIYRDILQIGSDEVGEI